MTWWNMTSMDNDSRRMAAILESFKPLKELSMPTRNGKRKPPSKSPKPKYPLLVENIYLGGRSMRCSLEENWHLEIGRRATESTLTIYYSLPHTKSSGKKITLRVPLKAGSISYDSQNKHMSVILSVFPITTGPSST